MVEYKYPKKISQLEWLELLGFRNPSKLSDALDFIMEQIDGVDSYYRVISGELLRYLKTLCKVHKMSYVLDYDKYGDLNNIKFFNEQGCVVGISQSEFYPIEIPDGIIVFRLIDSRDDEIIIRTDSETFVLRESFSGNLKREGYDDYLKVLYKPEIIEIGVRYCFVGYELPDDDFPPNFAIYNSKTGELRYRLLSFEVKHVAATKGEKK